MFIPSISPYVSPSASGTGLDSEHETVNRTDLPFTVDLLCVGRGGKWKWLCPLRETWERVAVRWGGQWQCFAGGPEHVRLWVLPSSSVGSQVRCCHCHLHKWVLYQWEQSNFPGGHLQRKLQSGDQKQISFLLPVSYRDTESSLTLSGVFATFCLQAVSLCPTH